MGSEYNDWCGTTGRGTAQVVDCLRRGVVVGLRVEHDHMGPRVAGQTAGVTRLRGFDRLRPQSLKQRTQYVTTFRR